MSAGVEDSEGGTRRAGTGLAPSTPASDSSSSPRSNTRAPAISSASTPAPPAALAPNTNGHSTNGRPTIGKHHHHVLIEPEEDRWAWRRRIRRNPHQLRIYRVAVGVAGLLLICLGLVSGPLPGPGGIPLVLLGLAVWSSEFEWAYRLRQRFKAAIKRFRGWSTRKQVVFWVVFVAVCGAFGYTYLLILGVPFWVPDVGANLLEHVPGVQDPG